MATSVPDLITQEAQAQGVDPNFALAIAHQESGFNQGARSSKGAMGVMQLMPATAKDLGVDPSNVKDNIKGGVKYLAQLGSRYNGDPALVAAAYNAGPAAVDRFGGVPPYAETQNYVSRVTGIHKIFSGAGSGDGGAPAPTAEDLAEMDRIINGGPATGDNTAAMTAAVLKGSHAETPGPVAAPPKPMAEPPSLAEIEAQSKAQGYKDSPPINGPAAAPKSPLEQQAEKEMAQEQASEGGLSNFTDRLIPFGNIVEPAMQGAFAAGRSAIGNIVSGKPILGTPGTASDPAATYSAYQKAAAAQYDKYGSDHPILGTLGEIGQGVMLAGPAGAAGEAAVAANAAPKTVAGIAKAAAKRAGTFGALGAGSSAVATAQRGGSLTDDATAAIQGGIGGAIAGAGSAIAEPIVSAIPTTLGRTAAGGVIGAGLSELAGQNPAVGGALGLAGTYYGTKHLENGKPSSPDFEPGVLSRVPEADVVKLENAEPGALAAEALGDKGVKALKRAAADDPSIPDQVQDAVEQRGMQAPDRVSQAITKATGVDPSTAAADTEAQMAKMRQESAKPAYDAALTGKPVNSPELQEQLAKPDVQKAYRLALTQLKNEGVEGEVDNPNFTPPKVEQSNTGAAVITPEVYRQWLAEGSNSQPRLMEMQLRANAGTSGQTLSEPPKVPTDIALDRTKKFLDLNYNATNPMERQSAAISGQAFRNVVDPLIPGYAEARRLGGEPIQFQEHYDIGRNALSTSKSSLTEDQFGKLVDKATPANIQALKNGIAADLHEGVNNAANVAARASTPKGQAILAKLFGPDQAKTIAATLRREANLQKSGARLAGRATPRDDSADHSPAEGFVIGMADGGFKHAAEGGLAGLATKTLSKAAHAGFTTKASRAVMAKTMMKDAHEAAAEIRAAKAYRTAKGPPKTLDDLFKAGALGAVNSGQKSISGALSDY